MCSGKIFTPDAADRHTMVVFVSSDGENADRVIENHRHLLQSLTTAGFSCCFFDLRPPRYGTPAPAINDMADDIIAVYNSLKNNDLYKDYKIGFYAKSNGVPPLIVAAAQLTDVAFILMQKPAILPFDDTILLAFCTDMQYQSIFLSRQGLGISYFDLIRTCNYFIQRIGTTDFNADVEQYCQQMNGKTMQNPEQLKMMMWQMWGAMCNAKDLKNNQLWNVTDCLAKISCPILYVAQSLDNQTRGCLNISKFEQTMFSLGKDNFSTILLDSDFNNELPNQMLQSFYAPAGESKVALCNGLILRWLNGKLGFE